MNWRGIKMEKKGFLESIDEMWNVLIPVLVVGGMIAFSSGQGISSNIINGIFLFLGSISAFYRLSKINGGK